MAWDLTYRNARLNEVEFYVQSKKFMGGNRVVVNEYPGGAINSVQHLGLKSNRLDLRIRYVGEDYLFVYQELVRELKKLEPVTYHDAYYGLFEDVYVEEWSLQESDDAGGIFTGNIKLVLSTAGEQIPQLPDWLRLILEWINKIKDFIYDILKAVQLATLLLNTIIDIVGFLSELDELLFSVVEGVVALPGRVVSATRDIVTNAQTFHNKYVNLFQRSSNLGGINVFSHVGHRGESDGSPLGRQINDLKYNYLDAIRLIYITEYIPQENPNDTDPLSTLNNKIEQVDKMKHRIQQSSNYDVFVESYQALEGVKEGLVNRRLALSNSSIPVEDDNLLLTMHKNNIDLDNLQSVMTLNKISVPFNLQEQGVREINWRR